MRRTLAALALALAAAAASVAVAAPSANAFGASSWSAGQDATASSWS